jgi:hypothetical protein
MVDHCLVFRPAPDSPAARRIRELRKSRPGESINHSDTGGLCRYPIGLSLEFKNQEGSAAEAEVQMGIWHAAQWRSLLLDSVDSTAIGFLPGIIGLGHIWKFVATGAPQPSTDPFSDDFKPKLYSGIPLGETSTPRDICKTLASLQCLVTHLKREYWPVYQEKVLQLPSTTPRGGAGHMAYQTTTVEADDLCVNRGRSS